MTTPLSNFYKVLQTLRDELLEHPFCNTVTTGDIFKVDLSKQTIFPLSHITVNNVSNDDHTQSFNISIMVMDIVNISKEETTDIFYGNNNELDILNTQLGVINKVTEVLRRGALYREGYELNGTVSCEPFYEKSENMLAGWVASFTIMTNNNIYIC